MRRRMWVGLLVLLALAGLLAACGQEAAPSAADLGDEAVAGSRAMTVYRSPT